MLKKRIIPCLDVADGRTVKGVNFVDLRDAGDAVALAKSYAQQGADELTFLDITATVEGRKTFADLVQKVALELNIPFTVGGGISSIDDIKRLLGAGAEKVTINSAAVANPALISQAAAEFGTQCIVVAVDTNLVGNDWMVYVHGGRTPTQIKTMDWVIDMEERGAGEILLTSMVHDGTKNGFALDLTKAVCAAINIPVIASGGAGSSEHFAEVFDYAGADAALAASVFHFGEIAISDLKNHLRTQNIPVR